MGSKYENLGTVDLIKELERRDKVEEDKVPPPVRAWRYRADCPKGKIFVNEEIKKAEEDGWFDTPAKIGMKADPQTSTEISKEPAMGASSKDDDIKEEVAVATALAKNKKLSHTAWMKALKHDPKKDRKETKKNYDEIVEGMKQEYGKKFSCSKNHWSLED